MAQNILFNGQAYVIPDTGEEDWGDNLTDFFVAIPQGALQKTGGNFTLSADVNLGDNFGPLVVYVKSVEDNIATAGFIRMANAELIEWRNAANSANLTLGIDGSGNLAFNGVALQPSGNYITALTGDVSASGPGSAAATVNSVGGKTSTQLAQSVTDTQAATNANTPSTIVKRDASGNLTAGTITATLIGNVTGNVTGNVSGTAANVTGIVAKANGGSGQDNSSITFPASGTLATTAGAETFTNKTFGNGPTYTQIATPSSPSSGFNRLYPKSDGNFYNLNSSGVETLIGAGSGGAKNYMGTVNNVNSNGNFELGSTTKWSLFNTTLTSLIPTGSITAGAVSITTFSVVSSGQLAGTYSLRTASSGAWSAGQGIITDAFTIDLEDQAKIMQILNYYKVVSGASNTNFSGTSANTFAIYLYDVTNSAWIQPAGVYSMIQNSGVGIANGTFQTTSNSTQYRLAIICINATAGAVDLYWDDFFLGPQIAPIGYAGTDWASNSNGFTPTSFGTVANKNIWSKQEGDTMKVRGYFQCGTPTASTCDLTLVGFAIDSTKLSNVSGKNVIGRWATGQAGAAGSEITSGDNQGLIIYDGSTTNKVYFARQETTGSFNQAGGTTIASSSAGSYVSFIFEFPLLGASSSTQLSNDTDTRVVAFRASKSGNKTIPGTATLTDIDSWSVDNDTHGALNATTGVYTVPVSGWYEFTTNDYSGMGATATGQYNVYLKKNGTAGTALNYNEISTGIANKAYSTVTTATAYFNAGDTVRLVGYSSNQNVTYFGSSLSFFFGKRLTGPSVIAASNSVNGRYYSTAGQSFATGSTTIVQFPTRDYDSVGMFSTSTYQATAQISGKYDIKACVWLAGSASSNKEMYLYKNGSLHSVLWAQNAVTTGGALVGCASVSLLAGDTFDIRISQTSGSPVSTATTLGYVWMSFNRDGN
jgi:hypothetical protein